VSEQNLAVLLHPALVALSGATDELVHLGVLSGTQIVYLDKVEPERAVRVWSAVGQRSPAVTTALGRALLAFRTTTRRALDGYLRAAGRQVDAERVWSAVECAREDGFATEQQENEPGISCLAVALLRGGAAVAARAHQGRAPAVAPRGPGPPAAAASRCAVNRWWRRSRAVEGSHGAMASCSVSRYHRST